MASLRAPLGTPLGSLLGTPLWVPSALCCGTALGDWHVGPRARAIAAAQDGRVLGLKVYPVKGCGPLRVRRWPLDPATGALFLDRRWCVAVEGRGASGGCGDSARAGAWRQVRMSEWGCHGGHVPVPDHSEATCRVVLPRPSAADVMALTDACTPASATASAHAMACAGAVVCTGTMASADAKASAAAVASGNRVCEPLLWEGLPQGRGVHVRTTTPTHLQRR